MGEPARCCGLRERQKNGGTEKQKTGTCFASDDYGGISRKRAKPQRTQAAENHCDFVIYFSVPHFSVAGFSEFRI